MTAFLLAGSMVLVGPLAGCQEIREDPRSGTVRVLGHPAGSPQALSRLGFLPEESNFYRFLTAAEQLDFFAQLFRLGRGERRGRIDRLIEQVGLSAARDRPIGGYSKGMARRVGLAQALLNDPELIILDEPTSGLDPIGSREVKDLILSWKREGRTVLVSSHLLADMESVCDRIAILAGGRLRLTGTVGDLLTDRELYQVDVEGLDEAGRRELADFVEKRGARIDGVRHPRGRLEDLFLRVVRGKGS